MRNIHHGFTIYATDDAKLDGYTHWKRFAVAFTRADAWRMNQKALGSKGYRHTKVTETRIYSAN
ncbi:MAG: hypothetical protein M3R04_05915 [bacterium]|nr:hypothetical protein [bacterium]